jgi:hypothetical protein
MITLVSRRARFWTVGILAVLLVGAFLAWGPIGLGSGPLTVNFPSGGQQLNSTGNGQADRSWGWFIPSQGESSGAVVDSVSIPRTRRYPGPRVLSLWFVNSRGGGCGGMWPWSGRNGLRSCAQGTLRHLIGQSLPAHKQRGVLFLVVRIAPPSSPSGCWVAASIIVHYHVGIRHYTVTSNPGVPFIACKTSSEFAAANRAFGQSN